MPRRPPGRPINEAEYLAERAKDHAKCVRALKKLEKMLPFAFITGEGNQAVAAAMGIIAIDNALKSVLPKTKAA
jgi:hypothetical protein